jgi:hemolysin III
LRGVIHEAGFYAALGAGFVLVSLARTPRAALALGVFAVSLATLLGISALYHRPTWQPAQRRLMRKLDHCGIFILIAGTYTPMCLLVLPPATGQPLLLAVWLGAAAGILQSLFWIDAPKPVAVVIAVVLGWFALSSMPAIWLALGATGTTLMLAGGLFYTLGATAYGLKRPNPLPGVFGYHEIFHALVMAAAIAHYAMILRVARGQ